MAAFNTQSDNSSAGVVPRTDRLKSSKCGERTSYFQRIEGKALSPQNPASTEIRSSPFDFDGKLNPVGCFA